MPESITPESASPLVEDVFSPDDPAREYDGADRNVPEPGRFVVVDRQAEDERGEPQLERGAGDAGAEGRGQQEDQRQDQAGRQQPKVG